MSTASIDERIRPYYAMIENLDHNVGEVNASLEAEELADDTIVVFTSDRGELSRAHDLLAKQQP